MDSNFCQYNSEKSMIYYQWLYIRIGVGLGDVFNTLVKLRSKLALKNPDYDTLRIYTGKNSKLNDE